MKKITVIAHAQYDFNDLQQRFVTAEILSRLADRGVDLRVLPNEEGIRRVNEPEPFEVLIVDAHSWKSSQDITRLCREKHPEAKVVMFDCSVFKEDDGARYDYWMSMSYLGEPDPIGIVLVILLKLKLWSDKDRDVV